jgi:hypothetical protein
LCFSHARTNFYFGDYPAMKLPNLLSAGLLVLLAGLGAGFSALAQPQLGTDPSRVEFAQAVQAFQSKDMDSAERLWEQLRQRHPRRPEAINNLAVIAAERGDLALARQWLLSAASLSPFYASITDNLARVVGTKATPSAPVNPVASLAPVALKLSLITQWPAAGVPVTVLPAAGARPSTADFFKPVDFFAHASIEDLIASPILSESAASRPEAPAQRVDKLPVGLPPTAVMPPPGVALTPSAAVVLPQALPPPAAVVSPPAAVVSPPVELAAVEVGPAVPVLSAVATALSPALPASVPLLAELTTPAPQAVVQPAPAMPPGLSEALDTWLKRWMAQDVDGYLAWYAEAFKPEQGLSRSQWQRQRAARVGSAQAVQVRVDALQVQPGPVAETFLLSFTQRYSSKSFTDVARKDMAWIKTPGGWRILSEASRPAL